jgi:hypothetical protein
MKKFLLFSVFLALAALVLGNVGPLNVKAETLEECIKRYQSMGVSYDVAKQKCYNLQVQTTPTGQDQPATNQQTTDSCVQKYMDAYKLTYDQAKQKCYPPVELPKVIQPAPSDDCVKKYMSETGATYEDAKLKCASITPSVQPLPSPTAVRILQEKQNCGELERRLAELTQKIQASQGQALQEIMAEIGRIKQELVSCQPVAVQKAADPCVEARKNIFNLEERLKQGVSEEEARKIKALIEAHRQKLANCAVAPAVTPGIKNPCDEVPRLKSAYEAMLKKEIQLKELIARGEIDKTALADLYRQMEFAKKRIEQTQFACQQGNKPVEESPCGRLAKLELIYSQNQDQGLVKEIIVLKERCRLQNLTAEKVESLADVEEIYKTKLKAVVEGAFGEEQAENLKQAEEGKNRLISDVVAGAKELDVRNITTIVKQIRIGRQKVLLESALEKVGIQSEPVASVGIQSEPVAIKIDVNGNELVVIVDPDPPIVGVALKHKGTIAKIDEDIVWLAKEGKLSGANSGKPINILPGEVKEKIGAEPRSLEINDADKPQYIAKVGAKGKLFGFIPLSISRTYRIDAETGESRETRPWWRFLFKY